MQAWLLEVAACPLADCGGRLEIRPGGRSVDDRLRVGLLGCSACQSLYPVLAGVPVLVPDPAAWLAGYRESVLAALAEAGEASPEAVSLIDSFCRGVPGAEPLRFGDDWTAAEAGAAPVRPPESGEAGRAFARFLDAAADRGPDDTLMALLDGELGTVWEVGCGAGTLSRRLRTRAGRLVVSDLSLRAALRARDAAGAVTGAPLAAAVIDAESIGILPGAVDTVVAAELVDLLDHPERFVAGVADALAVGGRLALATPAPSLGEPGDDDVLAEVIDSAGLTIAEARDAVPWIRAHDRRYYQVYFARVVIARAGSTPGDT
jgi:SAM-dependent methyltransferase